MIRIYCREEFSRGHAQSDKSNALSFKSDRLMSRKMAVSPHSLEVTLYESVLCIKR